MKYKSIATFIAMSALVAVQPAWSAHKHNVVQSSGRASVATPGEGLELGNFAADCCGGRTTSASAQTLHLPPPNGGFVVRLNITGGGFAETCVEHLDTNPTFFYKTITFNLHGPTSNFGVDVFYTPRGGSSAETFLTFANGGLHLNASGQVVIDTHSIPSGSRIDLLCFDLDNFCNSEGPSITDDISNLFIDKQFINYELDHGIIEDEGASCTGGGCG
ncbi:hypothetical protein BH10CYA1_BH10CYA1_51700 [soil metagenome]